MILSILHNAVRSNICNLSVQPWIPVFLFQEARKLTRLCKMSNKGWLSRTGVKFPLPLCLIWQIFQDDDIWVVLPEFISFLLSYQKFANRAEAWKTVSLLSQENNKLKDSDGCSKTTLTSNCPIQISQKSLKRSILAGFIYNCVPPRTKLPKV